MSTVKIERVTGERRTWRISVDGAPVVTLRASGVTDNMSLADGLDMVTEVAKALGAKVER